MRSFEVGSCAVWSNNFRICVRLVGYVEEFNWLTRMSLEDGIHLPSADRSSDDAAVEEFLPGSKWKLVDKAAGNLLPLIEVGASPVGAQVIDILHTVSIEAGPAPRGRRVET